MMPNYSYSLFMTGLLLAILAAFGTSPALAGRMEPMPPELEGVTVTEHIDAQIPLDLEFLDESGKTVRLADYFNGQKPVILTLNYFSCPMLCTLQLNGLIAGLKDLSWNPGQEFEMVTVSIHPGETPILAKNKKQNYIREYGRLEAAKGWHLLTGREENIRKLAETVGFGYKWNEENQQYMHLAALFVCTPHGRLSRYLYGVVFDPTLLRLSLVEAGEGKSGSTLDRILLFCYHYDATEGRYALAAASLMRICGGLTVLVIAAFLLKLWRREWAHSIPTVEGHQT